jgi:hypothetical protein
MSNPDLATLVLGMDLTTLRLTLNSRENLHKTFASPSSAGPTQGKHSWCRPSVFLSKVWWRFICIPKVFHSLKPIFLDP